MATLEAAGVGHSEDPSNRDPRFTRVRLRTLMPDLAREGLDAQNLARLARRMRRANAAIEFAVTVARRAVAPGAWSEGGPIDMAVIEFNALPAEVALRLLGQAIAYVGNEGPLELGKLEALHDALQRSHSPLRRTLAGALVSLTAKRLRIERAPPRRGGLARSRG